MSKENKEDFPPKEAGMLSELLGKIINGRTPAEMLNDPDTLSGVELKDTISRIRADSLERKHAL